MFDMGHVDFAIAGSLGFIIELASRVRRLNRSGWSRSFP
jgi:hypothetical protein